MAGLMDGMDVDLPTPESSIPSPTELIIGRLAQFGIPKELLEQLQPGLLAFTISNKLQLSELVSATLPTHEEILQLHFLVGNEIHGSPGCTIKKIIKDQYQESMLWIQWLMFESEPEDLLNDLAKSNNSRGVCGTVWGSKDIAYRCRTCEHDPTCVICVPCFQNGNHKDHDYSVIQTSGGCCDCGDVTAWKREGFCSKHGGPEQVQPLPEGIAKSLEPVLDALLLLWKDKLLQLKAHGQENTGQEEPNVELELLKGFSSTVINMLLKFCRCSESLLRFIAIRIYSVSALLDIVLKAERLLPEDATNELHLLILKLLAEPGFKYAFAKVLIVNYVDTVNEAIKESEKGNNLDFSENHLLSSFSVQIFTVPSLTPFLVEKDNLLGILLECLEELLLFCINVDGHIHVTRWNSICNLVHRLVEDAHFVVSHVEVPKFVFLERQDIFRAWLRILSLVQGMDPQKRVTDLHVEEENENWHFLLVLEHFIVRISLVFVAGAFSSLDVDGTKDRFLLYTGLHNTEKDSLRHAKVGRLSEGSSGCSMTESKQCVTSSLSNYTYQSMDPVVPYALTWLTRECLRALDKWLGSPDRLGSQLISRSGDGDSPFRRTAEPKARNKGTMRVTLSTPAEKFQVLSGSASRASSSSGFGSSSAYVEMNVNQDADMDRITGNMIVEAGQSNMELGQTGCSTEVETYLSNLPKDGSMEPNLVRRSELLGLLSLREWPNVSFDVGAEDISIHLPLHHIFSMLLYKTIKKYHQEPEMLQSTDKTSFNSSGSSLNLFELLLGGCHPCGFAAFMLEHPLRVRVFCAQVRAGMWRKNGHSVLSLCENYHNVHWCDKALELDLFMLQFCAAIAPPEAFVERILERYGLLAYLSLDPKRYNEFESALVQDMLTLIIQIVIERQLCGLSTADKLKRELIYRLAIGDATHSQLVKALPRSLSKSNQLQNVIDIVAVYSHPSGMKQGRYSLREAYWKELDLYHLRWNSRDLQLAEERYLRFCNVSAMTAQLPHWTKIFHSLSGISQIAVSRGVLTIVRAVVYYAVSAGHSLSSRAPDGVLLRALHLLSLGLDITMTHTQRNSSKSNDDIGSTHARHSPYSLTSSNEEGILPLIVYAREVVLVEWPDAQVAPEHQSLLSLLVLLMRKCKDFEVNELGIFESGFGDIAKLIETLLFKFAELDSGCRIELERLSPAMRLYLSEKLQKNEGDLSVSASEAEKRKAKAQERQAAIMAEMRNAQSKFLASLNVSAIDELDSSKLTLEQTDLDERHHPEEAVAVCSLCRDANSRNPVSYLVHLQKSCLTSFLEKATPSWDELPEKELDSCPTTNDMPDLSDGNIDSNSMEMDPSTHLVELIQNAVNVVIHGGQTSGIDNFLNPLSIAHYDAEVSVSSSDGLVDANNSDSAVDPNHVATHNQHSLVSHSEEDTEIDWVASLREYVQSASQRDSDVRQHGGNSSITNGDAMSKSGGRHVTFDGFGPSDCDGIHISSCGHAVHQECRNRYLLSLRQRYASRTVFEGRHIVEPDRGEFLCPVCRRFTNSILPVPPGGASKIEKPMMPLNRQSLSAGSSDMGTHYIMLRQALSFLQEGEKLVRKSGYRKMLSSPLDDMKPTLQPLLQTLFRLYFPDRGNAFLTCARVNNSMILWDVLRYSLISAEVAARNGKSDFSSRQKILNENMDPTTGFILSVLLQLAQITHNQNHVHVLLRFRGMQFFCYSIIGFSLDEFPEGSQKGDISRLLKGRKVKMSPDIQFWRRATDPILVHDPFSSLMWVLFCLPVPFTSWLESLLPLVHLFYAVSVMQALVTCIKHRFDSSDLVAGKHLISSIQKFILDDTVCQQYFASNYLEPSCPLFAMVDRFTLPYLRRCALLWKLLRCSASAPFCGSYHGWEEVPEEMNHHVNECVNGIPKELEEVHKLKEFFEIPAMEVVLEDEVFNVLAIKWIEHFRKGLAFRSYGCLYLSPAVQFQLIRLPHLYQDLLERYVKQQCPKCPSKLEKPALCLLCGRLCSPRRPSCCRGSECCQQHALSCAAGIGVFLLIKKTNILLQRSSRQSLWPSPYLDAFGEEDVDLLRGKPLYLNEERYATLTYLVVSHGLDRNSEVLRQTTVESMFDL